MPANAPPVVTCVPELPSGRIFQISARPERVDVK
jgi:hypothetical protein